MPPARRLERWPALLALFGCALLARAHAGDVEWPTHGGTYLEQRFAPLGEIDTDNVKRLGLQWFADFDTRRGQESTPLVVSGRLYVTTAWS